MGEEDIERRDLEALLATRQELGPTYEPALVDAFAERIERVVVERTGAALSRSSHEQRMESRHAMLQFVLATSSLVAAIPISIVLGLTGELVALLVAWVGIVAVNLAHASLAAGRRHR